jgi:sulfonate transport system permease protein
MSTTIQAIDLDADARHRTALRSTRLRGAVWTALSVVGILALWEVLSLVLGSTASGVRRVPDLLDVGRAFMVFAGYWPGGLGAESPLMGAKPTAWGATLGVIYNSGITLIRVLIGFCLGVIFGIGLAILVSWSAWARQALIVPAHFVRMMPLLAMIPLFGLWFGNSELGTYAFTAFAVAVLLFVLTINAIGTQCAYYRDYAASLGASKATIYRSVVLPSILPQLSSGLLTAVPFSWSAVLAAEIIGKQYGLGRILNFTILYAQTDAIAAIGLVAVILAALNYFAAKALLARLTRWS